MVLGERVVLGGCGCPGREWGGLRRKGVCRPRNEVIDLGEWGCPRREWVVLGERVIVLEEGSLS